MPGTKRPSTWKIARKPDDLPFPEPAEAPWKIGYARVSTADQDPQLQLDALIRDGVKPENIYHEKVSGAAKRRPQFEAMMKDVRQGDIVVIWKLDRLGRSLRGLLETIDRIDKAGAHLRVLTQHIDTSTPIGRVILAVLGAIAEFERDITRERTLAGLQAARERGRKGGAQPKFTDAQVRQVTALMRAGSLKKHALAQVGISPQQYDRRVKTMKEKRK